MRFELNILNGSETLDINDDNVDVRVTLSNGEVYGGTFITLENVKSLMLSYRETGECAGGAYFWASDMVLVEELNIKTLERTVESLLETGEIYKAFLRIK